MVNVGINLPSLAVSVLYSLALVMAQVQPMRLYGSAQWWWIGINAVFLPLNFSIVLIVVLVVYFLLPNLEFRFLPLYGQSLLIPLTVVVMTVGTPLFLATQFVFQGNARIAGCWIGLNLVLGSIIWLALERIRLLLPAGLYILLAIGAGALLGWAIARIGNLWLSR